MVVVAHEATTVLAMVVAHRVNMASTKKPNMTSTNSNESSTTCG